jgi:hypothetical protein
MPRLQLVAPAPPPQFAPPPAAPASPGSEQMWLFERAEDGGIDLAALRKERAMLGESQRAKNTAKAYKFDWTDFSDWCKRAGRSPLPASSDTVQLYMIGLGKSGRAVSTIARRAAAVAARHAAAGHRSPIDADVREVLAGLGRRLRSPTPRKQWRTRCTGRPCPSRLRGSRILPYRIRVRATPAMSLRRRTPSGAPYLDAQGQTAIGPCPDRLRMVLRLRQPRTPRANSHRSADQIRRPTRTHRPRQLRRGFRSTPTGE